MKSRYAYPLLFLVPSAMVAFLAAFVVAGAGAGVLWIFIYGDSPWPESAGTAIMALAVVASAAILVALLSACHYFGKSRESVGGLRRRHAAVAVGLSVLLPASALLHQWQVGNLG